MTFAFILLGVLIILTIFNVGESVYKKLNIKKRHLLTLLIITMILYFLPNIKINGITFTWAGFFLPLIFSIIVILKTKKAKEYFKMFVMALVSFSLNIVYNLITFDVYESAIFQPYLILAIILGIVPFLSPTRLYASNFVGLISAEIIFYLSRYSIFGEYYLIIGSRKVFEMLLVSFVASTIVCFLARKIKAIRIRHRLERKEREQYLG